MKRQLLFIIAGFSLFSFMPMEAQNGQEAALSSFTVEEMKQHIYFLASDYLNGRHSPTHEYEIASQYVASQFLAAGLEPVSDAEGLEGYMQKVPFAHTTYSEDVEWVITRNGVDQVVSYPDQFIVMSYDKIDHKKDPLVYVGYGIEQPEHDWNDFEGLDLEGKVAICLAGTPSKKGEPVLPEEVNARYAGIGGINYRYHAHFEERGVAAIIFVDVDGSFEYSFEMFNSLFQTETDEYAGSDDREGGAVAPLIYFGSKEFLEQVMGDNRNSPMKNPDHILKNYKPQLLKDTYLTSHIEMLSRDRIEANNVIGMVPGTDPDLKDEFIVVSSHLDHVLPLQGEVCNGADDNASGSAGVIEIAEAVAQHPCKRSVIFVTFTGEEMGLIGSRHFLESGLFPVEQMKFNYNMDMIGRNGNGNEESRAHYLRSASRYIKRVEAFFSEFDDQVCDFPILYLSDENQPGGSDHMSFYSRDIPAVFVFSGIYDDLHRPGDDANKIDYPKSVSLSQLGYLAVQKLGNMDSVPDFIWEE